MARLGVSNTTLWRLIKSNTIPTPRKLGRLNRWVESDINLYIESLTSQTTTA
ncbi:helix-turn-helix transcriptional regulator [Undibacterium sp. MH2W]|uniref:helix-turn-helix transcriptional regulator n=1 Tax=Undibacterium sp. MH2W TaxID=3413044 RepID=UPI003BF35386